MTVVSSKWLEIILFRVKLMEELGKGKEVEEMETALDGDSHGWRQPWMESLRWRALAGEPKMGSEE